MKIKLHPKSREECRINPENTETYMQFRTAIPKPSREEAHLRHILRFYMTRAMQKQGYEEIYILPEVEIDGQSMRIDVVARSDSGHALSICEPESVTAETEEMLELLTQVDDAKIIVVHSQYGNAGNIQEKFGPALESRRLRVLAVVPPPFDDVYEYDIWMFETTFRDLFEAG